MIKLFRNLLKLEVGIVLILVATLWGMAFPVGIGYVYLLLMCYFLLLISRGKFKININYFTIVFFICILIYLFAILLNPEALLEYRVVKSDLYVMMWSTMFALTLWSGVNDHNISKFIDLNKKIICTVTFILSLISLYKFYSLLQGVQMPLFNFNGAYAYGTALSSDMNMFALAMLTGLVVTLSLLRRAERASMRLIYLIPTITLTISVFMSGSRRGFILTTLVYGIAGLIILKSYIKKLSIVKVIIPVYFVSFITLLVYFASLIFNFKIIDKISELIRGGQFKYTVSRFSTISPENIGDTFSSRSGRWDYAFTLLNNYNPFSVLFGNGFNYIGEYRLLTRTFIEDYPHNFFVSSLLYSGVVGTAFLVMLFAITFYKLFKYWKTIGLHMVLIYLITFSYMFISGNSFFSYKFFVFITILVNFLPYRKNTIQKKKESINSKEFSSSNSITKTPA